MNQGILFRDLGLVAYHKALAVQTRVRDKKMADPALPDQLIFVEHPSVFTFGRNGGRENLIRSDGFLNEKGVDLVQTDRGGNITYHGPGQAVLYPIMDLERARIGVAGFVQGLEEVMLNTVGEFGIRAGRDNKNHGLWVGSRKIGSVGLSIKRGISIHGLALNINLDLTPFSWINPCGMADVMMTSLQQELGGDPVSMAEIRDAFIRQFGRVFNVNVEQEAVHV